MKLIKLKDVIAMTSLSKASIYRQIKAGIFPRPIKVGQRAVAWVLDEIDSWLESKKALRMKA